MSKNQNYLLLSNMSHNVALNIVPPVRAQSAELAQADSGARKGGIKLRLTACSGTFKYC